MTCALHNQSRLDPVTDEELTESRDLFVEEYARKLLATDMLSVLRRTRSSNAVLAQLYSCSPPDLMSLQIRFHQLMLHEARTMAMRKWTATEAALAIQRIQDGRI